MKLTAWGETIARIERERMIEAEAAIDAGWTPENHTLEPMPEPAPRRTPNHNYAAMRRDNASRRVAQLEARTKRLEPRTEAPYDAGMINIPMSKRSKSLNADITRGVAYNQALSDLAHARARLAYWTERAAA